MKKLIAISVMLALCASAVFADVTVGGQLQLKNNIMMGNSSYESYVNKDGDTKYRAKDPTVVASGAHEAKVKFNVGDPTAGLQYVITSYGNNIDTWGFMYWRFIPQVRLEVGRDYDGKFGHAQISGWGFTGEAKNGVAAISDYGVDAGNKPSSLDSSGRNAFYGGTGSAWNTSLSIYPIDGLTVNLWVPTGSGEVAAARYVKFNANVVYAIEGVGTVRLAYKSDTGYVKSKADSWWKGEQKGTPTAYAAFHFNGVPGFGAEVGGGYQFPLKYKKDYNNAAAGNIDEQIKYSKDYDIKIGLGANFTSGPFGIKLRTGVVLPGTETTETTVAGTTTKVDNKDSQVTQFGINILPNYTIGKATIYLFSGLGVQSVKDYKKQKADTGYAINKSNSVIDWFVNPYVLIRAGDLRFYGGVQFWSDGVKGGNGKKDNKDAVVYWNIPFGFNCYF